MRAKSALSAHEIACPNGCECGVPFRQDAPDVADRRARGHVAVVFAAAGDLPQAREELHLHAHARSSASAARGVVFGIGRRAFDPRVAVFEELVFPDRRDLLDALDRVAARLKSLRAVRRGGDDRDAGVADLEPADRDDGSRSARPATDC